MHRLSSFIVCMLLTGCGDPSATAPLLTLKVEHENGVTNRIGRHRVFHTGVLSESSDGSSTGKSSRRKVTVTRIADSSVALMFEMTAAAGADLTKELVVRYGRETKVELPNGKTLVASLEARK